MKFAPMANQRTLRRMIAAYESGKSAVQVGEAFGFTASGVIGMLRRAGVKIRPAHRYEWNPLPPSWSLTDDDYERMKKMRAAGRPINEIAARLGSSVATVWRHLRRMGVDTKKGRWTKEAWATRVRIKISPGDKFARLTAVRLIRKPRHSAWRCRCDCGKMTTVPQSNLFLGNSRSCGCLKTEEIVARNYAKRGFDPTTPDENWTGQPLYNLWCKMRGRCFNPKDHSYAIYGGAGRTVCAGWRGSYPAFRDAVSPRPGPGHSLDRVDNSGHYSCGRCEQCLENGWPMNVRWATKAEQSTNKSTTRHVTFRGRTQCLKSWATELGKSYAALWHRIVTLGWAPEEAFTKPIRGVGHGPSRTQRQQLKNIWRGILVRCYNPSRRTFRWYGARGIQMCDRWRLSFDGFFSDMGRRPSPGHSIDRIDNDGHYSCGNCDHCRVEGWPANCRWATRTQQARNRRRPIRPR